MARPIKRSKTRTEKQILRVWRETKRGTEIKTAEQAAVTAAIRSTRRYFEMNDYLEGTKHAEIFAKIYLSVGLLSGAQGGRKQKTMAGFAQALYIGENTLTRYTDKYIKCFEKYLQEEETRPSVQIPHFMA